MYEIKQFALYVHCRLSPGKIRTVYLRRMETPDSILADCSGCEQFCNTVQCRDCVVEVSKLVMAGENLLHAPYSSLVTPADVRAFGKKPQ